MELVEGDDLSQRIARGAIPLDEALPIAKQIAEALEAAHEQGIIHRDLKPANIKVRADGTVKVLGLRSRESAGADGDRCRTSASMSPTITTPGDDDRRRDDSRHGRVHGAGAGARAGPSISARISGRSGRVLFEMLTGTAGVRGRRMSSDTLARVIEREPAWNRLPAKLSPALRHLPGTLPPEGPDASGSQAIGDVRLALEGAFETVAPRRRRSPSSASRGRLAWMVAAAAVVGLAALAIPAVRYLRETPPPAPPESRVDIVTPATDHPRRSRCRPTAGRSSSSPRGMVRPVCGCDRLRRRRRSRWRVPKARAIRSGRLTAARLDSSPNAR